DRQLVKYSRPPVFGPLKRGRARTVSLSPEAVHLLREHRKSQNELKLKNRLRYRDQDLVFAKEWAQLKSAHAMLGDPIQANNIGQREFRDIIEKAKVRTIKFHGLRHTCATLLLRAGVPIHDVSERLGHKGIEITLNVYAHVLPDQQEEAAAALGSLLH
ncbi:MAG: site-specific integrase, partial [Acidobacteriota bacterium]